MNTGIGMRITTKRGDKGYTLSGSGEKHRKDSPLIEAFGAIDELISFLGVAEAETHIDFSGLIGELYKAFGYIAKGEDIPHSFVEAMDKRVEKDVELRGFIRPYGKSAYIHYARALARRAERRIVSLNLPNAMVYFNRLSDYLFIVAYEYAKSHGELRDME